MSWMEFWRGILEPGELRGGEDMPKAAELEQELGEHWMLLG